MEIEIADKLNIFLREHISLKEECEVVYIMVELRKLLDRRKEFEIEDDNFDLIKFYADWVVHTRKDRITSAIKKIMNQIDKSLDPYPKNGNIDFIFMPELKKELVDLFKKYKLPVFLFGKRKWNNFIKLLSKVLTDQPLISPINTIKEFCYTTGSVDGVMVTIDFNDSRGSIDIGCAY